MARTPASVHGILLVDKPRGFTSHDVVGLVRRIAHQREVGHAGTLDPLATGLLALGLGRGTRVLEYFGGMRKRYHATLRLGLATATYDAEGAPARDAPWEHVTAELIASVLRERFHGEILQRPPAYSAIKRGGVPLYKLARRGEMVVPENRPVTIYETCIERFAPPEVEVIVECSSGTYIRSLVHDLGEAVGSAAHLTALRRTAIGDLTVAESIACDALQSGGIEALLGALAAVDRPLWRLPAVVLSERHATDVLHGRVVPAASPDASACRAYDAHGDFLGLLDLDPAAEVWQPRKVIAFPAGV
jgi:tRNA pseudouridine55 synthase